MTRPARLLLAATTLAVVGIANGRAAPADGPPADRRPAAEAALVQDERLLASPGAPVADQRAALKRLAEGSFSRKDFGRAADFATRYVKLNGGDPEVRDLLTVSLFRAKRYDDAARALQTEVYGSEKAGQVPSEERLRWLLECYEQLNDRIGAKWVLERLVVHHPRREYWGRLLVNVDVAERLTLDVQRLRLLTGTLSTPDDYLNMAARAQRDALPAEARNVLEAGFTAGVLGMGADAARHRQLRDQAVKLARDDLQRATASDTEARARADSDGLPLVDLGFSLVTHGQAARGMALMDAGLKKGVKTIPQDSKLRLAIVHVWQGQRAKALELLRSVSGRHGAGDVARLWEWYLLNPEMPPPGPR
ncbi:hypothetical protein [Roseateles sp.]|uniref:hypothetical protein n=1 Tax=Roseateles sp. TaxID=1971397 RepID=UPI002F41A4D7